MGHQARALGAAQVLVHDLVLAVFLSAQIPHITTQLLVWTPMCPMRTPFSSRFRTTVKSLLKLILQWAPRILPNWLK